MADITTEYTQSVPSSRAFTSLALPSGFSGTLAQLGFTTLTPIQQAALPSVLGGRDLIGQAATGSGKTAVFALGLLTRLNPRFFGVQALVLCPTRELADQVAIEVRKLGRSVANLKVVTLCGGVPVKGQLDSLAHGAHVVVGTPGRILDHLRRGSLNLDGLRNLVLDEADRMLEMGFADDMAAVARECPFDRQTLLFSATYPPEIEAIAAPFLTDPVRVNVSAADTATTVQSFYEATREAKPTLLAALLLQYQPESTLVFVNTKATGREVTADLQRRGFSARDLSGDLEQRDRDEVMALFVGRCLSIVVATDVASRGLDVSKLDLVVNYDVSPDPEVHVHRVGRTGRAGEAGRAVSLVSPHEVALVRRVEDLTGLRPQWDSVPSAPAETGPERSRLPRPPMAMLKFLDGKKDKIRPGDVLGALTTGLGLSRDQVGTIKVTEWGTWVAVRADVADQAFAGLTTTPVKGKVRRAVRVG
ncbi:MAG: ATP-dependent RNA helicase DbpA [Spirochaetales bacterium]